eukprot:SAG31_NODE_1_length_62978_cov_30.836130_27_plen_400_part_00
MRPARRPWRDHLLHTFFSATVHTNQPVFAFRRSLRTSSACTTTSVRKYEWVTFEGTTGVCVNPSGNEITVDTSGNEITSESECTTVAIEWVGGEYEWDSENSKCYYSAGSEEECKTTKRPDRRYIRIPTPDADTETGICMQKRYVLASDEVSCTGSGVTGSATVQQSLVQSPYSTTATVGISVAGGDSSSSLVYAWQTSQLSCESADKFGLIDPDTAPAMGSMTGNTMQLLKNARPENVAAVSVYDYATPYFSTAQNADHRPKSVSVFACEVDRVAVHSGRQWSGTSCQNAAGTEEEGLEDLVSEYSCLCGGEGARQTMVACGPYSSGSSAITAQARLGFPKASAGTSVVLKQLGEFAPTTVSAVGQPLESGRLYLHNGPIDTQEECDAAAVHYTEDNT